jgi:hypothetical protein
VAPVLSRIVQAFPQNPHNHVILLAATMPGIWNKSVNRPSNEMWKSRILFNWRGGNVWHAHKFLVACAMSLIIVPCGPQGSLLVASRTYIEAQIVSNHRRWPHQCSLKKDFIIARNQIRVHMSCFVRSLSEKFLTSRCNQSDLEKGHFDVLLWFRFQAPWEPSCSLPASWHIS